MPFVLLLNILTSLIIARFGAGRKFGFWGYFFASLLLTPLIGVLLVIASGKKQDADEAK
jgi:hypothetical protein